MRVLTHAEREAFEIAFEYIARVVTVTHTTNKIYEIKVQSRADKTLQAIPKSISDMFLSAGIEKMQSLFMPYKKNKTVDILFKKFLKDNIQPRDYIFDGLLVVQPIKVAVSNYVSYSHGDMA